MKTIRDIGFDLFMGIGLDVGERTRDEIRFVSHEHDVHTIGNVDLQIRVVKNQTTSFSKLILTGAVGA